jgi:hypothetical protein
MSPIHSLPPDASAEQLKKTLNSKFSLLTTVVIDTGNQILNPDDLKGARNGPVVWLFYNRDSAAHTAVIDPATFKLSGTPTYENPLVEKKPISRNVDPGHFILLVANVRPDAQITKYKYSIASQTAGGKTTTLDPDLDVVDP